MIGTGLGLGRGRSGGSGGGSAAAVADVFAMNYSAGSALGGGWPVGPTDPAEITISRQAGIGPSGEDVYRYAFSAATPPSGDFGFGHGNTGTPLTGAPFAYGDVAYFRWKFRFTSGTNGRFYTQPGGSDLAAIGRTKFLILNDSSSGATSRFILTVEINRDPLQYYWRLQKGGGTDSGQTSDVAMDAGTWHAIQLRIRYSSAFGVSDGGYDLWVDNTVLGSPTVAVSSISMYADVDPGDVKLGAYQNNGLYSDGVYGFEQTGFAISESFTSGWAV